MEFVCALHKVDLSDNNVLQSLFGDESWKELLKPVQQDGKQILMSEDNFRGSSF